MAPFLVSLGPGPYFGQFNVNSLAPGQSINLGNASLDFFVEPEPGSAFLMIGGIALVEFLRRKSRR
jgi:hypothetical protein